MNFIRQATIASLSKGCPVKREEPGTCKCCLHSFLSVASHFLVRNSVSPKPDSWRQERIK